VRTRDLQGANRYRQGLLENPKGFRNSLLEIRKGSVLVYAQPGHEVE
jgi:hypothetical protein